MKLSAPSKLVFIISLVLLVIALLMVLTTVLGFIPIPAFWVAVIAWAVLAAGCLMTGM